MLTRFCYYFDRLRCCISGILWEGRVSKALYLQMKRWQIRCAALLENIRAVRWREKGVCALNPDDQLLWPAWLFCSDISGLETAAGRLGPHLERWQQARQLCRPCLHLAALSNAKHSQSHGFHRSPVSTCVSDWSVKVVWCLLNTTRFS